jgi:hypothetical protein
MSPPAISSPSCARCGAPAEVRQPELMHGQWSLVCRYCQATERLPADAEERARSLAFREELLRKATRAEEAPALAYAQIAATWSSPMVIGIAAVVSLGAIGQAIGGAVGSSGRLPASFSDWVSFATNASITPGVLAMFAGAIAGRGAMLRIFQKVAAPVLAARPQISAGGPLICRVCGAPLPAATGAQVICGHCSATNLVGSHVAAAVASGLDQQIVRSASAMRERLAPLYGEAAPARVFVRGGAVVAAVAFALLFVAHVAVLIAIRNAG